MHVLHTKYKLLLVVCGVCLQCLCLLGHRWFFFTKNYSWGGGNVFIFFFLFRSLFAVGSASGFVCVMCFFFT